jgi:nicotinate-nucleotide adenylyltransferase
LKHRWREVTALFGGTFDPPHLGHREAVSGLFETPGVKQVRILPSPIPPHKSFCATANQRLEMAKLNFSGAEDVAIDSREIERAKVNPQLPTYSFDTLVEMRREFSQLAFVIGADQLEKLSAWHRFPEILHLCHWIVLLRRPDGETKAAETIQKWTASGLLKPAAGETTQEWETRQGTRLTLVQTKAPLISSTYIRETIGRTGTPPPDALLPDVHSYLKLHRIYGMKAV